MPGFDSAEHPRDPLGQFVTVVGETAHYHGNLGKDRSEMPQLSGTDRHGTYRNSAEMVPKFIEHLNAKGIKVTPDRVPAGSLKATQTTGDVPAIRRIADNLLTGQLADTKPITVSREGRVLDGHHNWAGRRLADLQGGRMGLKPGMPVNRVDLPIEELIAEARQFGHKHGIGARKAGEFANPEFARRQA